MNFHSQMRIGENIENEFKIFILDKVSSTNQIVTATASNHKPNSNFLFTPFSTLP